METESWKLWFHLEFCFFLCSLEPKCMGTGSIDQSLMAFSYALGSLQVLTPNKSIHGSQDSQATLDLLAEPKSILTSRSLLHNVEFPSFPGLQRSQAVSSFPGEAQWVPRSWAISFSSSKSNWNSSPSLRTKQIPELSFWRKFQQFSFHGHEFWAALFPSSISQSKYVQLWSI